MGALAARLVSPGSFPKGRCFLPSGVASRPASPVFRPVILSPQAMSVPARGESVFPQGYPDPDPLPRGEGGGGFFG